MLNRLLKQLQKIDRVAEWLAVRKANREEKALEARHRRYVEEARKKGADSDQLQVFEDQHAEESEEIWAPIYARQSRNLAAQARKCGVRVPPIREESMDWHYNSMTADWYLSNEAEERLKREIRIEQRQNYDELRKWATLLFAASAFVRGWFRCGQKRSSRTPAPRTITVATLVNVSSP